MQLQSRRTGTVTPLAGNSRPTLLLPHGHAQQTSLHQLGINQAISRNNWQPRVQTLKPPASASYQPVLLLPYKDIIKDFSQKKPAPLPKPPKTATLRHVIPYIIKLALEETHLYARVSLAMICLLASKAAGLMCPVMFKNAINSFTLHAAQPLHVMLSFVTQALIIYGLCDILKHVSKELQTPLFAPVSQTASRRVAYHIFSHVLGLDIRFHLERRTGRLSRIIERGTRSIQMLYRALFFMFGPTFLELMFVCGLLGKSFSPMVGLLVLATFSAYIAWSVAMTQVATEARKHVNELDNATSAKAVDALLSYETVTLFNNQKLEVGQYNAYLKSYMKASITTDRLAAILNAGQAIILAVGLTATMITAVHTTGPHVTAGDLVMIQGLLLQVWAPLQFLGWFYRELRSALVDMDEFFAILRTKSNLKDGIMTMPDTPLIAQQPASKVPLPTSSITQNGNGSHKVPSNTVIDLTYNGHDSSTTTMSGDDSHASNGNNTAHQTSAGNASQQGEGLLVELHDVHFGYGPDRKILQGLSLRIQPGKSLALVGSSGSGKSTVLKLLTRLYDVDAGSVELNGVNVRNLTLESLRGSVAVVPQETMLFNDTILQNIRYGRPEATDEEVIAAAKMAHLDTAVMRMPQGYETVVGERGLKLSGGEKQRVAIARAFLRQPRLLICDEATSALDSATEANIMASLAELAVGRTSVFVAHRLSTVKNCDTIAVLKEGRLVEQGSHEELMGRPAGMYRAMWELQAAEEAQGTDMTSSNRTNSSRGDKADRSSNGSMTAEMEDAEQSDSEAEENAKVMATVI